MKQNVENKSALKIAYTAVKKLGYSQKRLIRENYGVNHNTLRRIQNGNPTKPVTDRFYLKLFVTLLKKEYERLSAEADTASTRALLMTLSRILYAELGIHEKQKDLL